MSWRGREARVAAYRGKMHLQEIRPRPCRGEMRVWRANGGRANEV